MAVVTLPDLFYPKEPFFIKWTDSESITKPDSIHFDAAAQGFLI